MLYVDRYDFACTASRGEQVCKVQSRTTVPSAGLHNPLDGMLLKDFLVVPKVERILQNAHAAVVQVLPNQGVVVPP